MKNLKYISRTILGSLIFLSTNSHNLVFANELLLANQTIESIEELKKAKVKKGKLIVKFCSELKDLDGYVSVGGKNYYVNDADKVGSKKIVWKDKETLISNSETIITDNLKGKYKDEEEFVPSKFILEGDCKGGFPIFGLAILAGIAAAAGGGGGGGTSSN